MFAIRISMPGKIVFLKEDFGDFYTYTHSILEAKMWDKKESAENSISVLKKSPLEKTEVIDTETLLETVYFANQFSLNVSEIKSYNKIEYPFIYKTLKEAMFHVDIMKDRTNQLTFGPAGGRKSSSNDYVEDDYIDEDYFE